METEQLIKIIEIIIWPATLVIVLFMFKKNITGIIGRIGSIEASASGLSMTFQEKIEETKKLLPEAVLSPSKDQSGTKSKSSLKIPSRKKKITGQTPYQTLLAIRDALNKEIIMKAHQHDVNTKGKSSIEISNELKGIGVITIQKAKAFQSLLELTNSADPGISQDQANQVNHLYENLNL